MIYRNEVEKEAVLDVAKKVAVAARTAPKACGEDSLHVAILDGEEKEKLADFTLEEGEANKLDFFIRDSKLLRQAHCLVLLGVSNNLLGLQNCGFCGFGNCAGCKKAGGHCALKLADLGIALGSAVAMLADYRIDNRIAFSIGKGALKMGIFPEDVTNIYAIPMAASGKSIFFDREAVQQK